MAKKLRIYSAPGCDSCEQLKSDLDEEEIEYKEVDITEDEEARERIASEGVMAVPAVEIDGEIVASAYSRVNETEGDT